MYFEERMFLATVGVHIANPSYPSPNSSYLGLRISRSKRNLEKHISIQRRGYDSNYALSVTGDCKFAFKI